MIYLDYSATTPMSERAIEAYGEMARQFFGNSNSLHLGGEEALDILTVARKSLADLLTVPAHSLYYTGSGSEANFLTITGLAQAKQNKGKHILAIQTEHHSVKQALHYLENKGFSITFVEVDTTGRIIVEDLINAIQPETILATFAHASGELGTVQDLVKIHELLKKHDILLFSDCVQTFGKMDIPIDVIDAFSISAHKVYGPKGLGAAIIHPKIQWKPFLKGTTHEAGFRAGTVDVPAIVAFSVAAEETFTRQTGEANRLEQLRQHFLKGLKEDPTFILEGHPTERLPFHIGLRRKGVEGQLLMLECKRKGLAISTGSACRAGLTEPPASLLAIGRSSSDAHEYVRITFGKYTSKEDVDYLLEVLLNISIKFKEESNGNT
ncbi:IscS subfamily cysteine desulfurase [Alkalihalobacillus sp. 1P02AB]|uniref:IscS subfamily cysteine desulfurase n=1 Tax=Alkalihalobacillus sp. 1P02AB TaxID=3132260 RepID=UPI0039A425D0